MKNLKFWQTPQFKQIEKQWYENLKKLGFDDHEISVGGEFVLQQKASNCYRTASQIEIESKILYFRLLESAFHAESFRDDVERLVMERRANGMKIKIISEELRSLNQRCHRQTIRTIIRKYETKWGIRKKKHQPIRLIDIWAGFFRTNIKTSSGQGG